MIYLIYQCLAFFLKSAAIIVSSGAKLDLQESKLFDNGEFGQDLDVSTELTTGAIVLEVCTITLFIKLNSSAKTANCNMNAQSSHELYKNSLLQGSTLSFQLTNQGASDTSDVATIPVCSLAKMADRN